MFSKTVFAFIALLPFCLAQINETEVNETASNATEPGSSASTILSSIPFKDYEAVCPYDGPVRIFQFKRVEVKNERDALLFNASSWPAEDMLLKAQCFDLKDFFGEEWVNVSTPECRLGEAFVAGETVWDNDAARMCKRGEYLNGISSEYVNGSRSIKIRCCQLAEFQQVEGYDCFNVPHGPEYNQILLKQRKNCSVDVLTSVTVSRGDDRRVGVVGRYCGFERKDFEPDPFCAAKRRVELKRARLSGEVPSDEEWPGIQDISIEEKQGVIEPGVKSTPGGSFDFVCPKYQAIDRVDVDMVDNDLVFAFYCDNVTTTGLQEFQSLHYSDYQPLPTTDEVSAGCNYHQDEVLCAVRSYISPQGSSGHPERLYSFGCCDMSNARVSTAETEELRYETLKASDVNSTVAEASVQAKGQFLHRFVVEKSPADNASSLITAWSSYVHLDRPKPMSQFRMASAATSVAPVIFWQIVTLTAVIKLP